MGTLYYLLSKLDQYLTDNSTSLKKCSVNCRTYPTLACGGDGFAGGNRTKKRDAVDSGGQADKQGTGKSPHCRAPQDEGRLGARKMQVKQLARRGDGLTNVEINDDNIKSFERVARKYGVDFTLKKDGATPPKWLVFFKAKDADALTAAFNEFTRDTLRREKIPVSSTLEQTQKRGTLKL